MKFSDFVQTGAIRAELAAEGKEDVIRELVSALIESNQLNADELDNIVEEMKQTN